MRWTLGHRYTHALKLWGLRERKKRREDSKVGPDVMGKSES